MGRVTVRRKTTRLNGGHRTERVDTLAVEEPLELRVGGESLQVTMRTPGDDFDLATGLLLAEGVITRSEDLVNMRYCAGVDENGEQTYNLLDLTLAPGVAPPAKAAKRNTTVTSACGVCGKDSLADVRTKAAWDLGEDATTVRADVLASLPERLRKTQKVFDKTGGLHAAGLFTAEGELLAAREDVGRHNAVDKVLGRALRDGLVPLRGTVLAVSGRASFELVQKAVMAGVPVLAAVSAPSSLAADLADEQGLTLAGFVRGDTMNLYTHPGRVA
ncbi:formate dehydrogenase accessory sulfurtransferase FdhD [Glycomyces sp. A-F 0318]|uniref:formate dehydrogenase accessory sulfurtransferase FdhD n=1 Tax=Glycomyces amatae TaxID=2881355 RepID=UPI001E47E2BD|nr:formate dehydrogenase accessory sulfurtransferase FdhD [Glycomyces amatae]MCD0444118.1 formate dehydrogenase accessory sulfurtransferase FdhD [Glycomyces amatae]